MLCNFKHCFTIKTKGEKKKKGKASYIQNNKVGIGFHSSKQIQSFHMYLLCVSQK